MSYGQISLQRRIVLLVSNGEEGGNGMTEECEGTERGREMHRSLMRRSRGRERGRRRGGGREGFNAQISLHHLVQLRGWIERIQRQTITMIVCGINKVKQTYTDAAMLRL